MFYLIKLIDNKVSLLEYNSDTNFFVTLKRNGEAWQEFKEESFWQWFKKKIGYDNEALSFAIVSDTKILTMADSIHLSKIHFIKNKQVVQHLLVNEISSNTQLYFIPHFDNVDLDMSQKKKILKKIEAGSLPEYYRNKTKLYRGL